MGSGKLRRGKCRRYRPYGLPRSRGKRSYGGKDAKIISTNYEHPRCAAATNAIAPIIIFLGTSMVIAGMIVSVTYLHQDSSLKILGPVLLGFGAALLVTVVLLCVCVVKPSCCFSGRNKKGAETRGLSVISGSNIILQYGQKPAPTKVKQYGVQPTSDQSQNNVEVQEKSPVYVDTQLAPSDQSLNPVGVQEQLPPTTGVLFAQYKDNSNPVEVHKEYPAPIEVKPANDEQNLNPVDVQYPAAVGVQSASQNGQSLNPETKEQYPVPLTVEPAPIEEPVPSDRPAGLYNGPSLTPSPQ